MDIRQPSFISIVPKIWEICQRRKSGKLVRVGHPGEYLDQKIREIPSCNPLSAIAHHNFPVPSHSLLTCVELANSRPTYTLHIEFENMRKFIVKPTSSYKDNSNYVYPDTVQFSKYILRNKAHDNK